MSQFERQHTRYDVEPLPGNVIPFSRQRDAYAAEEERAERRRQEADARARKTWEREQQRQSRLVSALGVGILIGLAPAAVTIALGAVLIGYSLHRARRAYRQAVAMGWV